MSKPLPLQNSLLLTYESRYRFYGPVHFSYRLNPHTESAGRGKAARVLSKPVNVVKLFFTPAFSVHSSPKEGGCDYCSLWCCIIERATDRSGSNQTCNVSKSFSNLWSITPHSLHDTNSANCDLKSVIQVAFII